MVLKKHLPARVIVFLLAFCGVVFFSIDDLGDVAPQNNGDAVPIDLGRHFFYDKRLSVNGMKSCSSCHDQRYAFSDGYRTSLGAQGMPLKRNALPIFNLDSMHYYTWADNRITDLQSQMQIPFFASHPVEMGFTKDDRQLKIFLTEDKYYSDDLKKAFPHEKNPYTQKQVLSCLADFLLQIQSYHSDYDLYLEGKKALTSQQQQGMKLFFSARLGCRNCHDGNNFSNACTKDSAYFNTGIIYLNPEVSFVDSGLYEATHNANDIGKFRVPSLRNLAFTAPYMHDGSMRTLKEVIDHYELAGAQKNRDNLSSRLQKFTLTGEEEKSLIAFLLSLSDSSLVTNKNFSNPFLP